MNYCTNCGAVLSPTDKFCSSCGKSVSRPEGETPPVSDVDGLEKTEKRQSPADEKFVGKNKSTPIRYFFLLLVSGVIGLGLIPICVVMGKDSGIWSINLMFCIGLAVLCAIASLVAFGVALAILPSLFSDRPGLLLNSEGFELAAWLWCGRSCFVRWRDVSGFREQNVSGTHVRVLVVVVKDQDRFVQSAGPGLAGAMKANMAKFGGPIAIPSTAFAIDFDELLSVFSRYFSTYRS